MRKKRHKAAAIYSLLWAGNPLSVSWLRFLDLETPVVRVRKLRGLE